MNIKEEILMRNQKIKAQVFVYNAVVTLMHSQQIDLLKYWELQEPQKA